MNNGLKIRGSLRNKIITWSFVPTVIILTTVALVTFYSYQQVTEDLGLSQSTEVVRLKRNQVQTILEEVTNPIMFDYIYFLDAGRTLNIFDRAKSLEQTNPNENIFKGNVAVLDKSGRVIFSETHPEWVGVNWAYRDFFRDAMSNEGLQMIIGQLMEDRRSGHLLLPFAINLRDVNGDFGGVAVLYLDLNTDQADPLFAALGERFVEEKILILDSSKRIVYQSDDLDMIGQRVSDREDIAPLFESQRSAKGEDLVKSYRTPNGDVVISAAYLETSDYNGWWVIQEQSWQDLMEPSLAYRRLLIILLAAGVIVPVIVVMYAARHLTRPIEEMIGAAKEVAGGNFGGKVEAKTNDELEELAIQFNRMSSELAQSYATLEKRVSDRTHELETINAISDVVNRSLDLKMILTSALTKTLEVTNMDAGVAYRLNEDSRMFEMLASEGFSDEYNDNHRFLPFSLTGFDFEKEKFEIIVSSIDQYPVPSLKEDLQREGVNVAVRLPLISKGKMLGYLGLSRHNDEAVTQDEMKIFTAIGQQISIAIENASLYQNAEETAATAERNRLARDLHDAVTQTLFSVSLIADILPELYRINEGEAKKRTKELKDLARGALAEMRTLLMELRPSALLSVSLRNLLQQLCDAANGRTSVPVKFSYEGERDVPEAQKIALYRMTQEAINNIIKYAQATQVKVELIQTPDFVEIAIRDNGIGFDMNKIEPYRMGLKIMHERAAAIDAELRVVSKPGEGTNITITWCETKDEEEE